MIYGRKLRSYREELRKDFGNHLDDFQRQVEAAFRKAAKVAAEVTEAYVERLRQELATEGSHGSA